METQDNDIPILDPVHIYQRHLIQISNVPDLIDAKLDPSTDRLLLVCCFPHTHQIPHTTRI